MKRHIQALLRALGLLERAQSSFLYDLYWSVVDRRVIDRRRNEEAFYRNLLTGLQKGDLIFDVGANVGDKTDVFVRLGASVVSVEPDEINQRILKRKFLQYRLSKKPVTVVAKALSDQDTIATMWIDAQNSGLSTLSHRRARMLRLNGGHEHPETALTQQKQVPTTTLEHLFSIYGVPFFVKIDVEGLELSVLRGLKRPVKFLQFEVNLPEFETEGLQCIAALASLSESGLFNYALDCKSGLELGRWLDAKEFARMFKGCANRPIEVFWRQSEAARD